MKMSRIPKLPYWLLRKLTPFTIHEGYAGDIEEEFEERVRCQGKRKALSWIWFHALVAMPRAFISNFIYGGRMFVSYIKIAFRNMRRHKVFSFINIIGLAAGMICFLLISLWVMDELGYDRFHQNIDHIFLVRCSMQSGDQRRETSGTPPLLGDALRKEYPEVVHVVRLLNWQREYLLSFDGKMFKDKILLAESQIFDAFTFPFVKGNRGNLSEPNGIVLSEALAAKYFRDEDPVGKQISIDKHTDVQVLGVMKDIPQNSSIRFEAWAPLQLAPKLLNFPDFLDSWGNIAFRTYVTLRPEVTPETFNTRITGRIRQADENSNLEPYVYPFKHYYLQLREKHQIVRTFSLIAVLILLMACINFINLSTARSEHRAREVGMRKVVGAARQQIVRQFLGESILYALIAMVLALMLSIILFPVFRTLTGKTLTIGVLIRSHFPLIISGVTVITGFISGLYPAFVLSSFHPICNIRGMTSRYRGGLLRKVLVLIQSVLSIFFIISFIVISGQIHFMKSRNPGFDREALLYLPVQGNLKKNYLIMKNELLNNPNITNVSMTTDVLSYVGSTVTRCQWEGKDPNNDPPVTFFGVDANFLITFNINLTQGRFFSQDAHPSTMDVVINETFANVIGSESPVGMQISSLGMNFNVIGVIQDFIFRPLDQELEPIVLYHNVDLNPYRYMFLKINPINVPQTISFTKNVQRQFNADFPFEYKFLEDDFKNLYRNEERTRGLVTACTVLTVFISSLGLFGLTAFMVERRKKEIGIRKIVGASFLVIVLQLSKDFLTWVIFASVISWPVAYYFMSKWLQNFAFRINWSVWIFILSSLSALIIAWLTISFLTIKAATAKPVDSLRYE